MTFGKMGMRRMMYRPFWGLTFTANEPGVTINMAKTGSPDSVSLEYCLGDYTDDANWTAFDADGGTTPITLTNAGDMVHFRAGSSGNTKIGKASSDYRTFTFSGSVGASGNIMSLLTRREGDWQSVSMGTYCFKCLFKNQTSLTSAPDLPATTLANDCYGELFRGCTALRSAPALPATTMKSSCYNATFHSCTALVDAPALPATTMENYCYANMFNGCSSLTAIPAFEIKTTKKQCCQSMFYNCTALVSAPVTLSAMTLVDSCYNRMFYNCVKLATAPATLPATTLANNCYELMFYNCKALASAPATLPATTLTDTCYNQMFANCTSITTAPKLPATTLTVDCYRNMFSGCTSLSYIEVGFTDWNAANNSTTNWVNNVASAGTFKCPQGLDATVSYADRVPSGWTVTTV